MSIVGARIRKTSAASRISMAMAVAWLTLLTTNVAADADYSAQIGQWRHDFDDDLRHGGWLALFNRVKLNDGSTSVGSDSSSAVLLPGTAARHVGTISRIGTRFTFRPAHGVRCSLDGKSIHGPADLTTKSGTGRIQMGTVTVTVRAVGEDFYAMVSDTQNPAIATFSGTSWFPVDPSWRIEAQFSAYDRSESVDVPMTHVDSKSKFVSTGDVIFQLNGSPVRLKTFIDDEQLFVMFADPTNGRETYGGGRFLHAPLPQDGTTTLDFNKAFNPYCSVNSNVVCPVVPVENRLSTRIEAGEKFASQD